MNIAFFVSGFPQWSETFVVSQITGLLERGHDVRIYATEIHSEQLHGQYLRYGLLERTHLRRVEERGWSRGFFARAARGLANLPRHPGIVLRSMNVLAYRRDAANLQVLDRALHFTDRPAFDIVHCHFGPNGDDAALLLDLGVLEGRLVTTFHGYDLRAVVARSAARYARLVRRCDAVHSICAYNRARLLTLGFAPERIVDHPAGVDIRRFAPRTRPRSEADAQILTVARLVPEKGLVFALEAFAEIRRQRPDLRFRYRIAGGGPLEARLRSSVAELGLSDVVELHGATDQENVRALLLESDLFLLPSVAEALPVSLMEAMACALPVVATDVGGVGELVDDGKTGRLVPPGDSAALARALLQLLDAPERWSDLGAAGRAVVVERHDIETLNDRLVEGYRALINRTPVPNAR